MPSECVKVMVRVRPLNGREKQSGCIECVDVDTKTNCISIKKPNDANSEKAYTFDAVFAQGVSQQSVYEASAFPLVESVFEGYNGTIFAYGQTGCGKTHTMMGVDSSNSNQDEKGIIPNTFQHIINLVECEKHKQFLVRVSFLEIYNEEIHDLLSRDPKAKYELKQSPEKGVFVKDLNQVVVKSVAEMEKLMHKGNENRSVGATLMNKDSSRSHSIFTIYIETSETDEQGNQRFRAGKLNLVDLAGSERQSKTHATGDRLKEANKINLSLSALGNVISALVDGKTHHIPYRDSKLTRLLEDSLGGNTKTIMIAAISPADNSYDETSGTLRYASRAKNIKNAPKINEDPKDTLLKEYADEINRLRMMLEGKQQQSQSPQPNQSMNSTSYNRNSRHGSLDPTQRNGEVNSELKQELAMFKAEVAEEKQRMLSEMESKDRKLQAERQNIDDMKKRMHELELQTMQGGGAVIENQQAEEQRKYLELKKKLKKQQKQKEQLLDEKRRNEEDLLRQGQQYQSMQDEVMELRESNKLLRKRLKQALEEVNDMLNEAGDDKEELLDAVRILERDNALHKAIIDNLLTKAEYEQIKDVSTYDEDSKTYRVPPFLLRNKEIRFPKLPHNQAQDQVNNEKENRQLEFERTRQKLNTTNVAESGDFDSRYEQSSSTQVKPLSKNNSYNNSNCHQSDSNPLRGSSRGRNKQRTNSINTKLGQNSQVSVDKSSDMLSYSSTNNPNDRSMRLPHNMLTEVSRSQNNPRRMIQGVVLEPVDTNMNSAAINLQQLIEKTHQNNMGGSQSNSGQPEVVRRSSKNTHLKPLAHPGGKVNETHAGAVAKGAGYNNGGGNHAGPGNNRYEANYGQNYY